MYSSSPYNNSSCRISGSIIILECCTTQMDCRSSFSSIIRTRDLSQRVPAHQVSSLLPPSQWRERNRSFLLGSWDLNARVCSLLVFFNLFKLGVVYTITSASSIRAILQSNCYHEHGHEAACEYGIKFYMLLFGSIHVIAS
ncbi:hypothetical protein Hdeb2414_s0014g00423601 [Helianthus debilis subsp. tardiflorus]